MRLWNFFTALMGALIGLFLAVFVYVMPTLGGKGEVSTDGFQVAALATAMMFSALVCILFWDLGSTKRTGRSRRRKGKRL